jgi:hypothetical protein
VAFGNAMIASASNDQNHDGEAKKRFESWANQEKIAGIAPPSTTGLSGSFGSAGMFFSDRKAASVCSDTGCNEDRA